MLQPWQRCFGRATTRAHLLPSFEGSGCSALTALLEAERCFADLRNKVPSLSVPSAQTPEAVEGQDSFKRRPMACAEGQQHLAWCIQSLCSLTTCTFCLVFLAWGALLTLKLWIHEGDGALSSLLVPQQYLVFLFSF